MKFTTTPATDDKWGDGVEALLNLGPFDQTGAGGSTGCERTQIQLANQATANLGKPARLARWNSERARHGNDSSFGKAPAFKPAHPARSLVVAHQRSLPEIRVAIFARRERAPAQPAASIPETCPVAVRKSVAIAI